MEEKKYPKNIVHVVQRTPEWLAWRSSRVTASDLPAIVDASPYSTPYTLWLEKTGRKTAWGGNSATKFGQENEDKARASYEINHGGFGEMTPICLNHPEFPDSLGCSTDGVSHDLSKILEIKCPGIETHKRAVSGNVPPWYVPQVQFQLSCLPEARSLDYWSYHGGAGAIVAVMPDKEQQAYLVRSALAFLELVRKDIPPPLTDRDDKIVDDDTSLEIYNELLLLRYAKTNSQRVQAQILKHKLIKLAGHPRVRCKSMLLTMSSNGNFRTYFNERNQENLPQD